jgi:hypothetical protein
MTSLARLGLKQQDEDDAGGMDTQRLNGLRCPFGVGTEKRGYDEVPAFSRLNGLGRPFGVGTLCQEYVPFQYPRQKRMRSPLGVGTRRYPVQPYQRHPVRKASAARLELEPLDLRFKRTTR